MNGLNLIIYHMMKRLNGERTVSGCYYILKGKKSGQAIQDAALFGYQDWYGAFPDLTKDTFQRVIENMVLDKQLLKQHHQTYSPAPAYEKEWEEQLKRSVFTRRAFNPENLYIPIAEVRDFWSKLQLFTQVSSHTLHNVYFFDPVITDRSIQQWFKQHWPKQTEKKKKWIARLKEEWFHALTAFDDELLPQLIVDRLIGYKINGYTFAQLEEIYDLPEALLRIYWLQAIRRFLSRLLRQSEAQGQSQAFFPLLPHRRNGEHVQGTTKSASKTFVLLQRGWSMERIAQSRGLRLNTIEDHVIELAAHLPDFDTQAFLTEKRKKQIVNVSKKLGTKKLRLIKQQVDDDISYFHIRLALIRSDDAISTKEPQYISN